MSTIKGMDKVMCYAFSHKEGETYHYFKRNKQNKKAIFSYILILGIFFKVEA